MNIWNCTLYRLIFFAVLTAGLSSCSTARMTIEVLVPPQNTFESKVQEVAVINRVDTAEAHSALYINDEFREHLDGLNFGMQEAALYGLGTALNDYGYYNVGEGKGGNYKRDGRFKGPKLSRTELKRLCALYSVEGIIALEGYEAGIYASGDVTRSTAVDRSYGTVYVPSFNGRQEVHMRFYFRFYDNLSGKIIYEEEIEDIMSTTASGSTPDEVEKRMPDRAGLMERLAVKLGSEAAKHISPHWKKDTRKYYAYGNSLLVRAGNLAQSGYWERASNIWYDLVEGEGVSNSVAKKACFNMILVSEVAGDLDLAIVWAERCEEEFGLKRATAYKELIKNRKEELKGFID